MRVSSHKPVALCCLCPAQATMGVRLKLQRVPPAVSYEHKGANEYARLSLQGVLDFDNSSNSGDEDYMSQTLL